MPKSYSKQFSLYDSGLVPSSVEQLPTASASVAFTVDSGKVFREDGEIVPVTLSNGIQYMPWGGDNPLPYHVLARYRGQVSVLRKSLVSPVAWEKWVGHWPYDLWPDQNQSVQKRLLPYVCLPNSRKIFTSGADCYVSLRMTTLVRQNSKYAPF